MNTQMVKFSEVITREEFKSGSLYFDTPNNLREYFSWIKERFDSGEQHPYDLEDLVGIVYSRKSDAVEVLERDFNLGFDYVVRNVNEINDCGNRRKTINIGGRPSKQYLLTPLCFEFMVARQCKAVFEIYHGIFHAVVSPVVPQMVSYLDMFDMMSKVMREQEARILKVESSQKLLEDRMNEAFPRESYITKSCAEGPAVQGGDAERAERSSASLCVA